LGVLTGLLLATIASFCGWLGWTEWQKWLNRVWLNKLPPMERLYLRMLQWTSEKGLGKHPAQTPLEYAQVSQQQHPQAIAEVIEEICEAYVGWRYGGLEPNWKQLQSKWQGVKNLRKRR
jgi:hypothetical protein